MDLGLAGVPCLVTGASRGLGRAIALALAAEGARVALACRERAAEAQEAAAACAKAGAESTIVLKGDLSSEVDVVDMFREAESKLGAIRVLVNNAAIRPHGTTATTSLEAWEEILGANLTGTFLACREFLRRLEGKGPPGSNRQPVFGLGFFGIDERTSRLRCLKGGHRLLHGIAREGDGRARHHRECPGTRPHADGNGRA